jgi:hypothetical protein
MDHGFDDDYAQGQQQKVHEYCYVSIYPATTNVSYSSTTT